ncbi:Glutamate formimidoyltransferase [bacterium HR15]|nr:Glutamate formimidoyltransferase [bacterium HR15]
MGKNVPRLLCVPNFSEGRNEATIHAIADAACSAGVTMHHLSWDYDHHRMVMAFSGTPTQVGRAVLRAAAVAIEQIDLRVHEGAHPRIGAVDVVPLVILRDISREQAVAFSHRLARRFARQLQVPVYLYEHSAFAGRPKDLPTIRKRVSAGIEAFPPDFGRVRMHPTAGATVIGVRDPLIAFNINLQTTDPAIARQIARQIRQERATNPDLQGVRALGFWLPARQTAQVSLNITQPDRTDLYRIVQYVRRQAQALGTDIRETELIGVVLASDAARALQTALNAPTMAPEQIIV